MYGGDSEALPGGSLLSRAGRQAGPAGEGQRGPEEREGEKHRQPWHRSHAGLAHIRRKELEQHDLPRLSCPPAPRLPVALQV